MKSSQAREVGCRPPWDSWSPTSNPVCETLEKNIEHEEMDFDILNYEPKIILNKTKCLIPCNYIEYKVIGEPTRGNSSQFKFQGIEG